MICRRDHINYARNEIKNYKMLQTISEGLDRRIEETIVAIENYKSSPVEFVEGTSSDPYWKESLRHQLIVFEEKKESIESRLKQIDSFLEELSEEERLLIENIYINNNSFIQEAQRTGLTKRTIEWDVENIMLKFEVL